MDVRCLFSPVRVRRGLFVDNLRLAYKMSTSTSLQGCLPTHYAAARTTKHEIYSLECFRMIRTA